jgi:hypothetical protein
LEELPLKERSKLLEAIAKDLQRIRKKLWLITDEMGNYIKMLL